MIEIHVSIAVYSGQVAAFERLAVAHQIESRREPGCVSFETLQKGIGSYCFVERWRDRTALEAHRQTDHYLRWAKEMPGIGTRSREVYEPFQTAWTNGCFDGPFLHEGHLRLLTEAAGLGWLTVALNSDVSARRLKGRGRPYAPQSVRAARLEALPCVGKVVLFDLEEDLWGLLRDARPSFLVKGADYKNKPLTGALLAGRVHFVDLVPNVSSTAIIDAETMRAKKEKNV